jgi:thiol-disulfide isomerase/thioredoxin
VAIVGLGAVALAASGCDDKPSKIAPDPTPGARHEAVTSTVAAVQAPPPASTAAHPVAPKAPRKICEAPPLAAGRSLPGGNMAHLEAQGTPAIADKIPTGGRWTWVNLWAAWCGPCKEEIPRLKAWETKLAQAGTPINLAFLSLDDDDRQARRFLDSQPPGGLKASWWLQEGKGRTAWLEGLRMKSDIQLPVQILVDPAGVIRCVVDGAIDDSDFPQVQAIVAKR